jgi:quercetin dioxygenase-like cupin family protein
MSIRVIREETLPSSASAREFVGDDHGVAMTFVSVDAAPGEGPSLHRHPYDEVLVVLDGKATLHDGASKREVRAGDIVVIPAGQPHGFVNSGDRRLRQIDIHASPRFATEWLTSGAADANSQ